MQLLIKADKQILHIFFIHILANTANLSILYAYTILSLIFIYNANIYLILNNKKVQHLQDVGLIFDFLNYVN